MATRKSTTKPKKGDLFRELTAEENAILKPYYDDIARHSQAIDNNKAIIAAILSFKEPEFKNENLSISGGKLVWEKAP